MPFYGLEKCLGLRLGLGPKIKGIGLISVWTKLGKVSSGVASYGARASLDFKQFHFSSPIRLPTIRVCVVCQLSINSSHSFDQHYISHKTISHQAAAAPDPEVRRECSMT